jgi:antitoxin (DNA-binding transcriptional repressor) of toxin-antitoxin stability system
MTQVTIHQAKTQLSRLIQKALAGEEVVIANRDKPVVRLEVVESAKPKRRLGGLSREFGQISWKKWKELDREIEADFYRGSPTDPLREKAP